MAKILVIEDESTLREDIIEWLSYEGYDAVGAADGVEGVNAAILHQPDLIVSDIRMPRLDGYGVLVDIKADSNMRLTPFIFLTAKAEMSDMRRGMQLGADDYLMKPFDRLDLLRAIETRLEKKNIQASEQQQHVELFKEMISYERAQRLLQSKLVSAFSHEFRDSLSVIQLASTLLRDFVQDKDVQRSLSYIDRIEAYVSQIVQLVDDMLLLAQMEAGKFTLKPEPVDPEAFIRQIVEGFQSIYGATRQIEFENHYHGFLMADTRLLRHIASNLMIIAIKNSRSGSKVKINVDAHNGHCTISVRSQGMFIPEIDQAHLAQLAEAFQDDPEAANMSSIEMGLAIIKQASEAHGGTLQLKNEAGVGTELIVTLPLQQA
ncbi:MAG: response regulator [Anaerolineae bacterium]|nr:response regulator [Anaerolineae bacterium]